MLPARVSPTRAGPVQHKAPPPAIVIRQPARGLQGATDAVMRRLMWLGYKVVRLWWFVRRPHHDGAVVAVWHDGRILLLRHSYRRLFGWPGGGVRRGEAPKAAALRELREELGWSVDPESLSLAVDYVLFWEYRRDHVWIFETVVEQLPMLTLDNREVVDAVFMAPDAALLQPIPPFIRMYLERSRGPA
jgi:8-oxo-dGTP diphosphatase